MASFGKPGYQAEAKTLIIPIDYPDLSQKELDKAYEYMRQEIHRRLNFEQLRIMYGDRALLRVKAAAYDARQGDLEEEV